MGCISSKTDINDLHPNIFQVMNVDDLGNRLSPGQLEITETDLVFYQRKKEPIKWPLRSLRRYGFDAELFSFESGRRCPTGPGIYAFRCQRAEQLFNLLQTHILVRNNTSEDAVSREFAVGSNPGPTFPARINLPMSDGNYLDPAPLRRGSRTGPPTNIRFASQNGSASTRLSSVGSSSNGPISPQGTASPSPPPLALPIHQPLPSTPLNSTPSSYYVNDELFTKVTNSSAASEISDTSKKLTPSSRLSFHGNGTTPAKVSPSPLEGDLKMANPITIAPFTCGVVTPSVPTTIVTSETAHVLAPGSYINIDASSGTLSPSSGIDGDSNYARLDLSDTQQGHLYMNIIPGPENVKVQDFSGPVSRSKPLYPSYGVSSKPNEAEVEEARHCYANLEPGEIEVPLCLLSKKPPATDRVLPLSLPSPHNVTPQINQFRQVNYIVLDLDQSKDASGSSNTSQQQQTSPAGSIPAASGSVSSESPHRASEGYATIDFNKTVALSHSVNPSIDNDSESSRKTRHNSTISDLVSPPTRHSSSD